MSKRVTIYARVSTKDQSLEQQVIQLQDFASARSFDIAKTYREKASGTITNRPQFQQLLDDVRKRKNRARF